MSKPLKVQILERARALIDDERLWCRGELAMDANGNSVCPTNDRAERHCALGALIAVAYGMTNDPKRARDLALTALTSFTLTGGGAMVFPGAEQLPQHLC